jgi:hypothetical protein
MCGHRAAISLAAGRSTEIARWLNPSRRRLRTDAVYGDLEGFLWMRRITSGSTGGRQLAVEPRRPRGPPQVKRRMRN